MNHAEIGAMIAEKWNFPDRLASTIRYHHDPGAVQEDYRDMVDAVYLANMFCEYEDRAVSFDQFETSSLENYGLHNKKHVDDLLDRLSSGFTRENQG
jgi:HD-like signal output (HDOD) protein